MTVIYNSIDKIKPQEKKNSNFVDKTNPTGLASMDNFLQLFTAQLKNQDPMDPMQNYELSSQLAQFTTVEQLTNMNKSLSDFLNTNMLLNKSINNNMATTLIGKKVKVQGNYITVKDGNSTQIKFKVPEDIQDVTIEILDENGKAVRTIHQDFFAKGNQTFKWDARDNTGSLVEDGKYTYVIKGNNKDGEAVKVTGYATGIITGVKYEGNITKLICGDNEYDISDVLEVYETSEDSNDKTQADGTGDKTTDNDIQI